VLFRSLRTKHVRKLSGLLFGSLPLNEAVRAHFP
jgi:hypothetical protein